MRTTRPLRIAARPPLTLLASRRTAVTITLGLNDEFPLQGCSRASSWRRSMGASPRCGHDKSRTTSESGALQALLDLPLTTADLMWSARQEPSRFPTTRSSPRLTPATAAQRTTELGQDVTCALLADVFAHKKKKKKRHVSWRIANFDSW